MLLHIDELINSSILQVCRCESIYVRKLSSCVLLYQPTRRQLQECVSKAVNKVGVKP